MQTRQTVASDLCITGAQMARPKGNKGILEQDAQQATSYCSIDTLCGGLQSAWSWGTHCLRNHHVFVGKDTNAPGQLVGGQAARCFAGAYLRA